MLCIKSIAIVTFAIFYDFLFVLNLVYESSIEKCTYLASQSKRNKHKNHFVSKWNGTQAHKSVELR